MSFFPCFWQTWREEPLVWEVLVSPGSKAGHQVVYVAPGRAEESSSLWNPQRLRLGIGREEGVLTRKNKLEMPMNFLPSFFPLFHKELAAAVKRNDVLLSCLAADDFQSHRTNWKPRPSLCSLGGYFSYVLLYHRSSMPTAKSPANRPVTYLLPAGVECFRGISAHRIMRQSLDRDSNLLLPGLLEPSWDGNNLDVPTPTSQQKILDVGTGPPLSWPAPENSANASWALGGLDHLGAEPFGASPCKLPQAYSLGFCILMRSCPFLVTLFKPIPISWSSKINCCREIPFTNLQQKFFQTFLLWACKRVSS